jgi:hypothetical protein
MQEDFVEEWQNVTDAMACERELVKDWNGEGLHCSL